MWCAGIGWDADGYECAVTDDTGDDTGDGPAAQRTRFPGSGLADLIAYLRDLHARTAGELAVVIDSTNGLLDGSLLAVGLSVYRADPPALPPRPVFGSVDAGALARTPLAALAELSIAGGTLADRYPETAAGIAASAEAERALAAGGRFTRRGGRQRPEVAITFDDGPDPRFTGPVLDILRDHAAPATFFCVGMNAAGQPDLVARAVAEGHTIANHTWSHPFLPELTRDEVLRQVDETNTAVARVSGRAPTLVRPPYGARTPQALRWLAAHGMTTVLWDVDAGDWTRPGADAIAAACMERARAGSVLLMHDGGGDRSQTVGALPAVLVGLRGRGLEIVALERVLT